MVRELISLRAAAIYGFAAIAVCATQRSRRLPSSARQLGRFSPARKHALDVAVRILADDATHEFAPEFAIAVELHLAVELVGRGLVRKFRVGAPVAIDIGAQVPAQQRLEIEDFAVTAVGVAHAAYQVRLRAQSVVTGQRVCADLDAGAEIRARALHGLAKIGERGIRIRPGITDDDVPAAPAQQLVQTEIFEMPAVGEMNARVFLVEAYAQHFAHHEVIPGRPA